MKSYARFLERPCDRRWVGCRLWRVANALKEGRQFRLFHYVEDIIYCIAILPGLVVRVHLYVRSIRIGARAQEFRGPNPFGDVRMNIIVVRPVSEPVDERDKQIRVERRTRPMQVANTWARTQPRPEPPVLVNDIVAVTPWDDTTESDEPRVWVEMNVTADDASRATCASEYVDLGGRGVNIHGVALYSYVQIAPLYVQTTCVWRALAYIDFHPNQAIRLVSARRHIFATRFDTDRGRRGPGCRMVVLW